LIKLLSEPIVAVLHKKQTVKWLHTTQLEHHKHERTVIEAHIDQMWAGNGTSIEHHSEYYIFVVIVQSVVQLEIFSFSQPW